MSSRKRMQCLYNVPLVPLNLRKEETILQIAEVVQYLTEVVDDVLSRVNRRIEENDKKLNEIATRIDVANNKVSLLTGAKKATRVFSSSKYPAAGVNRQYNSVFANDGDPLTITRNSVKCASTTPTDAPLENLQFYHVKIKQQPSNVKTSGLGKPPEDIVSLNEILLYNTGKNVYNKYEMSDTLDVSHLWPVAEDKDTADDIGAAPLSISERNTSNKATVGSFSYTPNLGDVPTIDVPLDLPDLPGIADDLRYTTHSDPTIAPSVTTTPNVPDLPPLVENVTPQPQLQPQAPPPPPLPVPIPPPPLEEPPQQKAEEIVVSIKPEEKEEQKEVIAPVDIHASLMEAIRKAGGSKNAKLKTTDVKKSEEPPSAPKVRAKHCLVRFFNFLLVSG